MYKDILYPVDISEKNSWSESLQAVINLVESFSGTLHVLTVISDGSMSIVKQYLPKGSVEKLVESTQENLHKFVKEYIPAKIKVHHIVAKGPVYECIIKTAEQIDADLIVMSASSPELKDYLLGPNAAKVVRHSNRSVLVVREKKNSKNSK